MTTDGTLSIRVNGEHRRVNGGLTLADLAAELGYAPGQVSVERNVAPVAGAALAETLVEDGDELEIVPVAGGRGAGGGGLNGL